MDNNNAKIVLPFYRLLNLDDLLYLDSSEPYLPTLLFEEEKKKKKKSDTLAAIDNYKLCDGWTWQLSLVFQADTSKNV